MVIDEAFEVVEGMPGFDRRQIHRPDEVFLGKVGNIATTRMGRGLRLFIRYCRATDILMSRWMTQPNQGLSRS